jgi:hypothetical protein
MRRNSTEADFLVVFSFHVLLVPPTSLPFGFCSIASHLKRICIRVEGITHVVATGEALPLSPQTFYIAWKKASCQNSSVPSATYIWTAWTARMSWGSCVGTRIGKGMDGSPVSIFQFILIRQALGPIQPLIHRVTTALLQRYFDLTVKLNKYRDLQGQESREPCCPSPIRLLCLSTVTALYLYTAYQLAQSTEQ